MKKITHKSLKKLRTKAWKVFSRWVRQNESDWKGYCQCVSCLMCFKWDSGEIHAGHYYHDKLDFDERNIHAQCKNCNYKYNKNSTAHYGVWMAFHYTPQELEELKKDANTKGNYYSFIELEEIIKKYEKTIM